MVQYRYLILEPVDRTSSSTLLHKIHGKHVKNTSGSSVTHVACKSKLRSVVRLSMYPCPGNWMAVGCAVVYYARTDHTLSAGIKCRNWKSVGLATSCDMLSNG